MNETKALNLGPLKRKDAPCGLCGGGGVVVREMTFRPCLCPAGDLPGVCWWDGVTVHPEDLVPTFKPAAIQTKRSLNVAETA